MTRPDLGIQIVRFRIVIGVRQIVILMVRQVQILEPAVWHHEPQTGEPDDFVYDLVAKRMAVDHLMGQRGMQRDEQCGRQDPDRKPERRQPEYRKPPARITDHKQSQRRPFHGFDQRALFHLHS